MTLSIHALAASPPPVPPPVPQVPVIGMGRLFDVNDGVDLDRGMALWPQSTTPVTSAQEYADFFCQQVDSAGSVQSLVSSLQAVAKADMGPPSLMSFARLSTMPNAYSNGIANPPGIPPSVLKKIAEDHFAPKVIIQQRVADVMRYAEPSTQPWKPGWRIELREGLDSPTTEDKKDMKACAAFLSNCCEGVVTARERDAKQLLSLRDALAAWTRDRFRYDFVTTWTDMDTRDRVRAFKPLPAHQIRLTIPGRGYDDDPEIFAVAVDDGNKVIHKFTRRQAFVGRCNVRTDAEVCGYGYPEIEMAMRLIQGFTNVFELNVSVFDKSAMPNGILMASGMWTQKQLDIMSKIWQNLKRGTSKTWALPVIPVPKDGELKILDFSQLKDNDAYYQDLTNMLSGLYCAIFGFPVSRLGYRTSGRGPENNPKDHQSSATLVDEADPALPGLLGFLERYLNEYIVWSRWPRLQFRFQGKNPKEDARAYEAQMLSCTWNEKRALVDMAPLEAAAQTQEQKDIAEIMALCPVDPNLASSFMATVQLLRGQQAAEAEAAQTPGTEMRSKRDPGTALDHGHEAGVRRDSNAERAAAKKAKQSLYISRPVVNTADIIGWARRQGFGQHLDPHDLHVTVAFSRAPVDWDAVDDARATVVVPQGGYREVAPLGDKGAVVLHFEAPELSWRWQQLRDCGCSWDYPTYRPHMTITYAGGALGLDDVVPYDGPIVFGPEVFAVVDDDYVAGITEVSTVH